MKNSKLLCQLFFFTSISFSQIVDVFISDWYIGWRGDGVYNNLVELYNPKEDTINLANYVFRRTQNGSGWLSTDPDHFLRIPGIIPPGQTFSITRASADPTVTECANRTFAGGEPAGYVDPDAFLKQNGDDAFGVFYIGGLGDDTTSWIENGTLLDAVGVPGSDPGSAWDASGTPEATRYHILQRKFDVCGGNSGDWNASRGCIDESCSETSYALSEWEVINCTEADPNGSLYPEPEIQDASSDMQVICGGHQYLCLNAPNGPPGTFSLQTPVTQSHLNINSDNISESLTVMWSESYDPDGHDLLYTFNLSTTSGDIILSEAIENQLELSIDYQIIYDILGPNNTLVCYWDMNVTDLYDTTHSGNGPFLIQIASDEAGGLNQPPSEFDLLGPDDYTLAYINPNNPTGTISATWNISEDPDEGAVSYNFITSLSASMSDPTETVGLTMNNTEIILEDVYETLLEENLQDGFFYWDIKSSDGIFEQSSRNGPFLVYFFISEDPTSNEDTYKDLFISDWYIGHRSSPVYNAAVELYNPKEEPIDLSNYILRRTQNGSHWMESSWVRLEGILPPNTTYVVTRSASDQALQDCADFIDPDDFLKHNGDDGFKITHIGYLPESLSNDTTAWLKMGLTLDAIGYAENDPGLGWDVSGVSEATRYYILSRNMDVCGGNGGDWNASRGCVNLSCDSTTSNLSEWTPISGALSPAPGDMPEGPDASIDALIFCGNHNYFCTLASLGSDLVPQKVKLEQNYPNPFNPKTEIKFSLSNEDQAVLKIFNLNGQEVITIVDHRLSPGNHSVSWIGKDSMGREVASGIYFYKLVVGNITHKKKLILLR